MINTEFIKNLLNNYPILIDKFNNDGLAMFFAQCHHESMGFTKTEENLNYSAERLLQIFPKYFNQNNVQNYARQPEKIANIIYANRMGNGNEQSGNGYKYKGRGYIQLTGFNNYFKFSQVSSIDFIRYPELLAQEKYSLLSAIWFFENNNLINNHDCKYVTKIINGSYTGLVEREKLFIEYSKFNHHSLIPIFSNILTISARS